MKTEKHYVAVQQICTHYEVSLDLLITLEEFELLEITHQEGDDYLEVAQLAELERCLRLSADLGINVEGLAVIVDLLNEREQLRQEIQVLKNRLLIF